MDRARRALKFVLRWGAVGLVTLLVLELLCHVVTLSNDSLAVDYAADPYCSYRMAPAKHTSALGIDFDISSQGLRNREVATPKPPGTFRVLVLGDSVTLGYGVPVDATYTHALEGLIGAPNVEVINAGASGWVLADSVAYLEHYGLALEPDMIVAGVTRGDLMAPIKYEIRGGVGYEKNANVSWIPPFAKKMLRHSRLYLAVARIIMSRDRRDPSESERGEAFAKMWPKAKPTVDRLVTIANEHRLPLLVAYLPISLEVARGVEYPAMIEELSHLDAARFGFVNVLPRFVADDDKRTLYLPMDPAHPTPRGHQLIARVIFEDPFFRGALPPGTKFASQ
jgi:lysophospholipase L1-like esterase